MISGVSLWLSYGLSAVLSNLISSRLTYALSDAQGVWLIVWPIFGLIVGISAGLLAGLLKGGLACLRHYVLRFLLWRNKAMPWNYPRFLDYAAEHILLRKVGGGYIFVHRLLLEYFASLDTTAPSDATSVKK